MSDDEEYPPGSFLAQLQALSDAIDGLRSVVAAEFERTVVAPLARWLTPKDQQS